MAENYHDLFASNTFADIVLPLALPKTYTYYVPEEMVRAIRPGIRVEVQMGKSKLYSGIVVRVHDEKPEHKSKPILTIIDDKPVIYPLQIKFWQWLADYYATSLGAIMIAALPANLKLTSETKLTLSPVYDHDHSILTDREYLIAEALTIQEEITIDDVRKIIGIKTVYSIINGLLEKKVIYLKEELKEKYKPKKIACIRLAEIYRNDPALLEKAFEKTAKSGKQTEALMALIQVSKKMKNVRKSDIYAISNADSSVLNALEKKGIAELYKMEISRTGKYEEELITAPDLSPQQQQATQKIKTIFKEKDTTLLYGVTGSGKTQVYIEHIKETIAKGGQVLYLLPEVSLTAQIINRLQAIFGDDIAVYHHKINGNERVDLWKSVIKGKPIILAARSGLFLPFKNLKLIIVDEEHDTSYKQTAPAPRYHARDAAIVMAKMANAKVILGTATPAVETYHNALTGKYGLVTLTDRFGGVKMPEFVVVDVKKAIKQQTMLSHFTPELIEELKTTLANNEQAILFQNRRGYAPALRCTQCGWVEECNNCDVSLTYHKFHHNLQCHYCGFHANLRNICPACGNPDLTLMGFGTEKIEDELKIYLPEARIGRLDYDTVRTKHAHTKIIKDFEENRFDILVGTQMVTKGLDFDNVRMVGIISSDQLLQFPDFRSAERGFQIITQVAGRAGRKEKTGKVIIQAINTDYAVLKDIINYDYESFYQREIMERKAFGYPPFSRLIKISLKHKRPETVNVAAKIFTKNIRQKMGDRVIGPAVPYVARVRGQYILDTLVKLENRGGVLKKAKEIIREATIALHHEKGFSSVRVIVDVDPL